MAPAWVISEIIQAVALPASAEVTLEANPEDITAAHCQGLLEAGVTRLSLGVQTFQEKHARLLNRASTVEDANSTVRIVSQAGFRSWSVDLIFSLPNQTMEDLQRDLDVLSEVQPPHVSLYGLTAEPNTPFGQAVANRKFTLPTSDYWISQYEHIQSHLRGLGMSRYEVSNFAQKGHECAHNLNIWRFHPYMGVGPAAHGLTSGGRRTRNLPSIDDYLKSDAPLHMEPTPDLDDIAIEYILGATRLTEGIHTNKLQAMSGHHLRASTVQRLVESGLIQTTTEGYALTKLGFHVADGVTLSLTSGLLPCEDQ
jgi:oxygen-independent coproporphyrinogen-3 oxidase